MGQCQCTSMEDHGQWIVSHGMGLVMFMMSHSPKLHAHGPVLVDVYGRPCVMDSVPWIDFVMVLMTHVPKQHAHGTLLVHPGACHQKTMGKGKFPM
jgi:hypothetical protein